MTDQTNWFNANLINKKSVLTMVNMISSTLNRTLTRLEGSDFLSHIKKNKSKNWNLYKVKYGKNAIPEIQKLLVKNYMNVRFTSRGRNYENKNNQIVDVKETLKFMIGTPDKDANMNNLSHVDINGLPITKVIAPPDDDEEGGSLGSLDEIKIISNVNNMESLGDIKQLFGKSDQTSLQLLFNPDAAYKSNYVMLDTRHRRTDTDGTSKQSWNFLSNSAVNSMGSVNSLGNVKNIVSISIPKIRIPYKDVVDLNGYERVSLLIEEFSGQAHIGQENRKFHFMFEASVDGNSIDLLPLKYGENESGTFEFVKPITQIDTITITWGNPLEDIIFDKDRNIFSVSYTNPASFTSTEEHKLLTGDLIYIKDFTSNDTVVDENIINNVNRVNGHNIVYVDDFTFEIDDLDLTTVTAPIIGQTFEIFFGSNRIFIPMLFKFIYTPD